MSACLIVPDGMQTTHRSKNLPFQDRYGITAKELERKVQLRFRFGGRSSMLTTS